MLDENQHVNEYDYHGGRIEQHYVVTTVQLKMSTNAVSNLAARMHAICKNIRYFLVIEIEDRVLSYDSPDASSQIVLENVVISHSKNRYDDVFFGA